MTNSELETWERRCEERLRQADLGNDGRHDPAHDLAHFKRVVATSRTLALSEGAKLEVVLPAAWLHDLVNVPKNDPRRSQASRLSAKEAREFLAGAGYPAEYLDGIAHAIEAHSFSAKIEPRSLEARVVQDADRLDGLGAIGVARCFAVAGLLGRPLYHAEDPFGWEREWNDLEATVDHFYVKLFKTVETLTTAAGREEGAKRAEFMKLFLGALGREIGVPADRVRTTFS